MKMALHLGWKLTGGILLLVLSFILGHYTGSRNPKPAIDVPNNLTATDMDHAFGSIKKAELEPIKKDSMANSLDSLVAGLEKKVAANPENIDQQLLLAKTYSELGNREKSLSLLRPLSRKVPKNAQVKITLASVLMKGMNQDELKESLRTFDDAIKLDPNLTSMARAYQDEIRVNLNQKSK